ncbi:hypothetical protein EYF80_043273 [Liparis tanakae]|uniref:Uncharacterized protein n=1 Tax=Liparis tanakae TaxID=230148 RepID=A0A4Z2FZ32_9TELE|nr:hypothetical protein EYF80_043273 [Liparis tanakae]
MPANKTLLGGGGALSSGGAPADRGYSSALDELLVPVDIPHGSHEDGPLEKGPSPGEAGSSMVRPRLVAGTDSSTPHVLQRTRGFYTLNTEYRQQ